MTPQWDTYTPEFSYWQNELLGQEPIAMIDLGDWIDELP